MKYSDDVKPVRQSRSPKPAGVNRLQNPRVRHAHSLSPASRKTTMTRSPASSERLSSAGMPSFLHNQSKPTLSVWSPYTFSVSDDNLSRSNYIIDGCRDDFKDSKSNTHSPKFVRRKSNLDLDMFTFSDLDYTLPSEVREILQEEGVDNSTTEAWLRRREVCHKRAEALRQIQMAKNVKPSAVKKPILRLPPIKPVVKQRPINERGGVDENYQSCVEIYQGKETPQQALGLPEIRTPADVLESKSVVDMDDVLTEVEEMQWKSEQQIERLSTPSYNYTPPRLVLISSRISWCRSMARAVRQDGHVFAFIYDFESWSFKDIINECKSLLDSYRNGCKASSILLVCKGGPGFLYVLKNYVVTSQKMSKTRYTCMKDFWKGLSDQVSKLDPESAYIHIIGGEMEGSYQAKMLRKTVTKSVRPNKVKVECLRETSKESRETIELYFDYRKYLLWRSRAASQFDLQDTLTLAGSWSYVAEEEDPRRKAVAC